MPQGPATIGWRCARRNFCNRVSQQPGISDGTRSGNMLRPCCRQHEPEYFWQGHMRTVGLLYLHFQDTFHVAWASEHTDFCCLRVLEVKCFKIRPSKAKKKSTHQFAHPRAVQQDFCQGHSILSIEMVVLWVSASRGRGGGRAARFSTCWHKRLVIINFNLAVYCLASAWL